MLFLNFSGLIDQARQRKAQLVNFLVQRQHQQQNTISDTRLMKILNLFILFILIPSMLFAQVPTEPQPLALKDFSGGLNTTSSPTSLQLNESSDAQNVHTSVTGAIVKRKGYTQLNTVALTGMVNLEQFENDVEPSTASQKAYSSGTNTSLYQVGNANNSNIETFEEATVYSNGIIGDVSGTEYISATEWTTDADSDYASVASCEFQLHTSAGSPTGNITAEIWTDDGSDGPNAIVHANATGSVSPTANAWNTVTFAGTFTLSNSTKYWILLSTVAQATNSRYQWKDATPKSTANGMSRSTDGGSTWEAMTTSFAGNFRINTSTADEYDWAQSFQLDNARTVSQIVFTVGEVNNSYNDTVTVSIESDSSGPSGTTVGTATDPLCLLQYLLHQLIQSNTSPERNPAHQS